MASSRANGINFVRIYFYKNHTISEPNQKRLVALAYATARDLEVAPKAILIRFVASVFSRYNLQNKTTLDVRDRQTGNGRESVANIMYRSTLHATTSFWGRHVLDPKGYHLTMAFKTEEQLDQASHVASHGYTSGKSDFVMVLATHTPPKPDDTPRGDPKLGKVVWPMESKLVEYVDSPIAYSHIPEKEE